MGKWTHAVVIMSVIGFVLFFVPGNDFPPETLDLTNLKEVQAEGDMTGEMKESIPTSYEAPSTEVALKALPYKLALPSQLPFEAKPFKVLDIKDWNEKDGKEIRIELMSVPKINPNNGWIMIEADDHQNADYNLGITESVQLANDVEGEFQSNATLESSMMYWSIKGVQYTINYKYDVEHYDKDKHFGILTDLANQMIKAIGE